MSRAGADAAARRPYHSIAKRRWVAQRPWRLPPIQLSGNGSDNFLNADGFHAAEIDRTLTEEARAAFDLVANHFMARPQRPGEPRLRRAEDRDDGNTDQGGEVHRPGVVREQEHALSQSAGELIERCLTDPVGALYAQ